MDKEQGKTEGTENTEAENSATLGNLDALAGDEQEAQGQDEKLAMTVADAGKQSEQERQEAENRAMAAKMGAAMAVGFVEETLKMRLPYVTVEEQQREKLEAALAPVLEKHGGGMPEWLQPYAEEIKLGMTLAGFGFGVWMQVKAHNEALKPANDDQANGNQGAGGSAGTGAAPEVQRAAGDGLDPSAGE